MTAKSYHLGDILSVVPGRLVSPRHVDGVYDILSYLCGESLMTHQLPEASRIATPYLIDQHPWLADVTPPERFQDEAHVWRWLADMVAEHGEQHEVDPLPPMAWGHHNPIADLLYLTGGKPIIGVVTD